MLEGFQLHPQNKIPPQKYTTCLQCGTPGQPSLLRSVWRPVSSTENTFASESILKLRWRQRGSLPALPACLPATWEKKEKKKYPGFLQMSVFPASSSLGLPSRAGKEERRCFFLPCDSAYWQRGPRNAQASAQPLLLEKKQE